jgi:hypothetical protein
MAADGTSVTTTTFDWYAIAIVVATLFGPVLAVQAQKWLERGRDKVNRQTAIFRSLMVTRSYNVSLEHVQAINAIPIEFYGKTKIIDAWRTYLKHLSDRNYPAESWGGKRVDLLVDLLQKMAAALRYDFDVTTIKEGLYAPDVHGRIESQLDDIRQGVIGVLSGETPLPMALKELPVDPDVLAAQKELQTLLKAWLTGQATPRVEVTERSSEAGG